MHVLVPGVVECRKEVEYWGANLRPGSSSGIDFAFPADFLSLPAAVFKADNALAAVEQHRAKLLQSQG